MNIEPMFVLMTVHAATADDRASAVHCWLRRLPTLVAANLAETTNLQLAPSSSSTDIRPAFAELYWWQAVAGKNPVPGRAQFDDRVYAAARDRLIRGAGELGLELSEVDSSGARLQISLGGPESFRFEIYRDAESPDWLILVAPIERNRFASSRPLQRLWLDSLSTIVNSVDCTFGMIGENHVAKSLLETSLPWFEKHEATMIRESRTVLRGYEWLTVIPGSIVKDLGGPAIFRNQGFYEVRNVTGGGVWIQSTEDFSLYTYEDAKRLFDLVRPALRSGQPRLDQIAPWIRNRAVPPPLVMEDASTT